MKIKYHLLCFALAIGTGSVDSQILNGDFQQASSSNCSAGASWITSAGALAPQHVIEATNSWIDMTPCGSFGNGTFIEQQVSTSLGQVYYIEMDIATCFGWQIWDTGFDITINGVNLNAGANRLSYNTFDQSVAGAMKWTTVQSTTFSATGSSSTIRITGNGANPMNPSYQQPAPGPGVMGLDNIALKTGIPTGVEKYAADIFTIFPNPANDRLNVRFAASDIVGNPMITDITGKQIRSIPQPGEISVNDLPAGVYFILARPLQPVKMIIAH